MDDLMQFCMITCQRENGYEYLARTIDSLERSGFRHTLRLLVDGPTPDIRLPSFVSVLPFPPTADVPSRRFICQMNRTLTINPRQPLVVLEDDLAFREDWYPNLVWMIESARQKFKKPIVLSLFSEPDFLRQPFRAATGFVCEYGPGFQGTQAVYYDPAARWQVSQLFYERAVECPSAQGGDLILGDILRETDCHLLAVRYSLVQHTGRMSTGLSERFVESPTFDIPIPRSLLCGSL